MSYRDRILSIHRPTEANLKYGLWNPRRPPFDPVISLWDLAQPQCPKYLFLKHIKGREPQFNVIFRNPNQKVGTQGYRRYFKQNRAFNSAILKILNYIVWYKEGKRLINQPIDSVLWSNLFKQAVDSDVTDIFQNLKNLFQRLQDENVLNQYLDSRGNVFFNFQIFNPEIELPSSPNGMPYELALKRTDQNPRPYRYRWDGTFPGYAIIPEINIENQEIVLYYFYSRNFISPDSNDVISQEDFSNFENQMFIIPHLHYLWLIKIALSTLRPDYLQKFELRLSDYPIFQSLHRDDIPKANEFSTYSLRLETLDRTYTEDLLNELNINLPLRSAQALMMMKLIQGRRPNIILNQDYECPIEYKRRFCGLQGSLGCALKDYVQIPTAVVEDNVLAFQNYIRDEITLKSSNFYFLNHFLKDILELKNRIGIWMGQIVRRDNNLYYENEFFDDNIPREQKLFAAVWSPFLFSTDLEVKLLERDGAVLISNFSDNPIISQYLRNFFDFFSDEEKLPVILGEFPTEEYFRNFRRQQLAIWHAANFMLKQEENESIQDFRKRVLESRLTENDKRAGEGIFGDRVKFI